MVYRNNEIVICPAIWLATWLTQQLSSEPDPKAGLRPERSPERHAIRSLFSKGKLLPFYREQDIMISRYRDIYISGYRNIKVSDIQLSGYPAYRLSDYPIGWISNWLLSLTSSLSKVPLFLVLNNRAFYAPIMPQPSEQRRMGGLRNQDAFTISLCRRPPYSSRLSIALTLTLSGQKGPISFWGNRSKRRLGRASPACLYGTVKGVLGTLQGFPWPLVAA